MNVSKRPIAGFTLVEIMIVVAIVGLLATIAVPNYVHARQQSQTNACINNLRVIDATKQLFALENGSDPTYTPTGTDLQPYFPRGLSGSLDHVYCPLSGAGPLNGYAATLGDLSTAPTCANVDPLYHPASIQ